MAPAPPRFAPLESRTHATASMNLAELASPADAARSIPSHGSDWDAAIELGVDVCLILRNLELEPRERMRQAAEHQRFIETVHERSMPAELRVQLERERLWAKIEALGGPDPGWPPALRERPPAPGERPKAQRHER